MENQFSFDSNEINFDIKVLLLKILSHWKWFLISLLITFFVAHYFNVRKQNIYELDNYVTVKEENNPLFTSNMSLVFNWGGVSDKVDLIITTFKSRTHNEKTVRKLKSYINYYKQGKYYPIDIYANSPFTFVPNENKAQLIDLPINIKIVDNEHFKLSIAPKEDEVALYDYTLNKVLIKKINAFEQTFSFNQPIDLPFLSGKITRNTGINFDPKDDYMLKLQNFDKVVAFYKNHLNIKTKNKNSSILILKLRGANKEKIVDYLNTTTQLLKEKILEDKNRYAINTIKFIDSTLKSIKNDLNLAGNDLKKYVKNKTILNLDDPTSKLYEKITDVDLQKNQINQKQLYYRQLQKYLENRKNYEDLPAPTVVGIDDPTIVGKVSQITKLAIERKKALDYFSPDAEPIKRLDLEIESLRKSLINTVHSALNNLGVEMNIVNSKIKSLEAKINKLPEEKQVLIELQRKFDLKEEIYNTLLQKRNEASIVKASNISDLKIIDKAKNTGQPPVAPNRKINYLIALALGLLIPALFIIIAFFLDNKVHDISTLEELTNVPILGQVYHHDKKGKLPVKDYPQGIVAESFRSLRSALRFMFPGSKGTQSVIITSSVSGEGKTFISANLALIQAASNKKTVLLEFDLRKPKFKEYFEEAKRSHTGLSQYLTGDATIDDIIIPSGITNLDLILSGKIPPNPSELILTEYTKKLFSELAEGYDQVIIDSPPMGLVSDAMELQKYAGVTVFVVREDYSLKSFVKDIDERHSKKEIDHIAIIYNDFKVNMLKKYGYSKNYGYSYGYGYGGYFDKKDSFWKRVLKKIGLKK